MNPTPAQPPPAQPPLASPRSTRPSVGVAAGALLGVAIGAVTLAALMAHAPELTVAAVLGVALLGVTLRWPFGVLTALLVLGPVDLSLLTGGLKDLVPGLGRLDMNGIRLVAASAGFGAVILLDPKLRGLLVRPPALIFVAFLAWCGVTLLWSPDPLEGLRLWLKMAWPLVVFLLVAHPDRTPEDVGRMVSWVLAGAFLLLILNPFFVALGGVDVDSGGRMRVGGLGIHQNPFSFYLLTIILIASARFLVQGLRRDVLLVALALGWMGLTLTRITLLAGLVTLFFVGVVALWRERNVKLGLAVGAALAVLVVVFVPFALLRTFGEIPTWSGFMELVRDPLVLYQTVNLEGREVLWAIVYTAWTDSPWVGGGMGAARFALLSQLPPEVGSVPHNEYLRLGADAGWVGLTLAAATTVALGRAALSRATHARNPWTLPALSALLVWAVVSITDNALDYYAPFTQFVGFLVAAAVVWNRHAQTPDALPSATA